MFLFMVHIDNNSITQWKRKPKIFTYPKHGEQVNVSNQLECAVIMFSITFPHHAEIQQYPDRQYKHDTYHYGD